jgi:rod shape-determining protein MreD
MGILIAAVGATVAAVLEASVLTQLLIGGVKPDLVLAITLATAMVLGFDQGITWAVVGGLLLDLLLPERAVGSTTLALLLTTGVALLIARTSESPRLVLIGLVVFVLTFVYQGLLMVLLAITSGASLQPLNAPAFAVIGLMNAGIAVAAAWLARGLALRFGRVERPGW